MTPDPTANSLPGTSLLAFARLWFSPAIVASVFEPLVADWQSEARTSASPFWINLRWRLAFLANGVMTAPRLVAAPIPFGLLIDITIRAVLFGTLGFVLQQAFGRRPEVAGAVVIDSLPFALLPVVLRLRRHRDWSDHAARALALQCATAVAIVLALFAGDRWSARLGAAVIPLFVAFMGWRLGDARRQWSSYQPFFRWWLTVGMLASTWGLAVYPLKYALGFPVLGRFWGADVQYLLAILLSVVLQAEDWRERRRTNERRV